MALGIVKYFYNRPSQPIGVSWFAVSCRRPCKCQRWSRGHKARGQGQGHKKNPRPRPRTAFPRTEPLEAKDRNARGQGQGPRTPAQVFSKKKKVFKNFFQAISNLLAYSEFLIGVSPALNCRGAASPHRDLASSQQDLSAG